MAAEPIAPDRRQPSRIGDGRARGRAGRASGRRCSQARTLAAGLTEGMRIDTPCGQTAGPTAPEPPATTLRARTIINAQNRVPRHIDNLGFQPLEDLGLGGLASEQEPSDDDCSTRPQEVADLIVAEGTA